MADLPLISLVTPSFNQAGFLGSALDSVAAQAYPHLEYIVADGGSTDGTRDLLRRRQAELTWWCSERDAGMYDAINKGFARTTGEIMGWLNSDDILLSGALRAVGEIFRAFPEVQWLSSLATSTLSVDGILTGIGSIAGYSAGAMLDGGYLPNPQCQYGWIPQESTFWRRSLWEASGARVDARFASAGDFELWLRFFERTELVGTPTPIGAFRVQPAQKSRNMEAYLREAHAALAQARSRARHRSSRVRSLLRRSRLPSVPGLRALLAQSSGYHACKICAQADGGWRQIRYRFL